MGQLGMQELLVIFLIALLVFGPKKLPELGKSLGKGLREFRRATNEMKATWDEQLRDTENDIRDTTHDLKKTGREIERDLAGDSSPSRAERGEETSPDRPAAPGDNPSAASSSEAGPVGTAANEPGKEDTESSETRS